MARILGLVSIAIGDVAADGGMGASLISIGDTVKDSAVFTEADGPKQEFFIEESDDPIESIVTQKGIENLNWSTHNTAPSNLARLFGGVGVDQQLVGGINVFGTVTGGSAYTNGIYTDVPLTGGAGTGAKATITVAGGAVTTVVKTAAGSGYSAGAPLGVAASSVGGTGTGFAVAVTSVYSVAAPGTWEPPDTQLEVEKSVRVTDRKGNKFEFVRVKLAVKKNFSFQSTKLGQIDIVGTILTPAKAGVKKYLFTAA